jgi:hypothetical protein
MGVTAGIFLASILLKEMRYLVYIRYLCDFPYETPGKCEFMGDIDHATLRFERRYPNKDVVKK